MQVEKTFRIYDFNVYNEKEELHDEDGDGDEDGIGEVKNEDENKRDTNQFYIQMFGINEKGKSCSIIVEGFKPFFYIKVDESWNTEIKNAFLNYIKKKIEFNPENNYYENSIHECKLIKRKKLYGFDGGKEHKFIELSFNNFNVFNKVKNLWYQPYIDGENRKLLENGLIFKNTNTYLYESNIPPLLRFFHIKNISPSGWIALPINKLTQIKNNKKTTCYYEFRINFKHIIPLNEKENIVPLKICSFDIEASSSHGDFPVPLKTYKKLSTNIIEYIEKYKKDITTEQAKNVLFDILLTAFGYDESLNQYIDKVYPIKSPKNKETLIELINKWLSCPLKNIKLSDDYKSQKTIENMFEKMQQCEEDDEENIDYYSNTQIQSNSKNRTIIEIICDKKITRTIKIDEINESLDCHFPKLEGDKCTFIGSTFLRNGEKEPYRNHCVVLNSCSNVNGVEIQTCKNEKELLLKWRDVIREENPDVIIGFNIFGFDYPFLFCRAEENDCVEEFLKLSKNKNEICGTKDFKTHKYKLEQTSIQLASGQHDLKYIKMNGRIQIDLYNFFRREENLNSYKLDYVAGHFIGDYVSSFKYENSIDINGIINTFTIIKTLNMTGLHVGSYIHFEEIGHSVEYYNEGLKFLILEIDKLNGIFKIAGNVTPDMNKKIRWCLAKDDVTPKDIFRMTNGSPDDRATIAKYCIQDCNLVQYLMNKVDIWTGYSEMSKICSVPINFLVLRGQGIKLTSYVSKKCREKKTLMPVIEKSSDNDGFEGAIVLDPKCDLYLDNPIACVDYAALYPSSMMSENISHDSKVWTKEYDLNGRLIKEDGEKDKYGNFIYDNLPNYEYVDIPYDTFIYKRKSPSAAAEKIKCGHKICRFAQFPEGERAIMPSILEELLLARKTTRKMIPLETDEFMKNVLDKRQLGYKVTANSLYGQCGAKTSSFYEKDCAASTTATGRLLLIYAKNVIEECYGNTICDTTKYGPVLTKAEYIYGDTDSVFFTFNLQTLDGELIRGKKALEITIELAQQAGHLASKFLKGPHDLEYEKTFMPFCLLSKKRYVGILHETDPENGKRKDMGIVSKRRDNAPIVKDVYGGIIDILMKEQNIEKAVNFLKDCLRNMVDEKYPIEKLIISKSLRSGYKNPQQISHKVLADRMTQRDPGNKPGSGDRIPYVFIHNTNKKALQGDRIETPTFIIENKLKIDYSFYITNQIMKPVSQVFALVLEKIWKMQKKNGKIAKFNRDIEILRDSTPEDKFEDKLETMRNKEVKLLLFDDFLRETNNKKNNVKPLTSFFLNISKR